MWWCLYNIEFPIQFLAPQSLGLATQDETEVYGMSVMRGNVLSRNGISNCIVFA